MLILPVYSRDIDEVMDWSELHFGLAAADRYAVLIEYAMSDLVDDPVRPGAKALADFGPDIHTYHLRFSRDGVPGERVKQPRHSILYRHSNEVVEFARLLHDGRDLEQHLPGDYRS